MNRIKIRPQIVIFALTAVIYANTLGNSFVYDDWKTVGENTFIRDFRNLPRIFTPEYFRLSGEMTYRPVVTLSYFLDFALWRSSPGGYHFTNLFLHCVNAVLLYQLLRALLRNRTGAFFSALLFGCHPVNSEAVNAIGYREDLLAFLFFLLSFIFYLKSQVDGKRGFYFAALLGYVVALLAKEMAVTLPLVLITADAVFRRKETAGSDFAGFLRRLKSRYAGFLLIAVGYLGLRFTFVSPADVLIYPVARVPVIFLTVTKITVRYLRLLIWPFDLCAEYNVIPAFSFGEPEAFFSLFLVAVIIGVSIRIFRFFPVISFALWYFFLTLLPVSNIFPLANPAAERYLYIPGAGFCLLLGEGISRWLESTRRREFLLLLRAAPGLVLVLLLAFYSVLAVRRNFDWKDDLTLCRKTLTQVPESSRFHSNLGLAYYRLGKEEDALSEYLEAISLRPDYQPAYYNLGAFYGEKGKFEQAVKYYQQAIRLWPEDAQSHYNLAGAYVRLRELDEAVRHYREAVALRSEWAEAHNNLGGVYLEKGSYSEAREEFQRALEIDPGLKQARLNLQALERKKQR